MSPRISSNLNLNKQKSSTKMNKVKSKIKEFQNVQLKKHIWMGKQILKNQFPVICFLFV